MPEVTRRQFLRTASIGAAAAGALAVAGPSLIGAIDSASGAPGAVAGASEGSGTLDGSDIFARVVDARAGTIKIFIGTRAVDYTNQALAQQLLQAAQ